MSFHEFVHEKQKEDLVDALLAECLWIMGGDLCILGSLELDGRYFRTLLLVYDK